MSPVGFLDRVREGRNDRREHRLARAYTRQVDDWLRQCQRAIELSLVAQRPGVSAANAPVELWEGERLLMWWTGAELISPKNTIVRNWTSASYRVGKKTTVRAGTSTMHSTIDRPTPIDHGTLAITDRRVLFLGRTRSIDWQFRRMLGVTHDASGSWTAIHVSNRQRLHGIGYPRSRGDDVRFYLALAAALYRGEESDFARTIEADTLELVSSPPSPPSGLPVDERVANLEERQRDKVASGVKELAPSPPPRLVAGFASSPLPIVATAGKLIGFLISAIQPGKSAMTPEELDGAMKERSAAEGKPWAAAITGDAEFAASYLDGLPSATVRFVCTTRDVLEELGIDDVEVECFEASEIGYAETTAEEIVRVLQDEGYRATPASLSDSLGAHDVAVLDAAARIARWTKGQPQALVLSGPRATLKAMRAQTRAFDLVAFCAGSAVLADLGIKPIDLDEADDDVGELIVRSQTPPMTVAGQTVENPVGAVAAYLVQHPGTVMNYDLVAGTYDSVTPALIRATRRPWMNSRISAEEEAWFIERSHDAPWDLVPGDALLRDADPRISDGLYDRASVLWDHFSRAAPTRVGVAKVSKVLHLMRPGLFPILDSRLTSAYDRAAREAARELASVRRELAGFKRLLWEAVRRDLVANEKALEALRAALPATQLPLAHDVAERVQDIRLLDMIAWAAGGGPEDRGEES